jgi:hypothetical protein
MAARAGWDQTGSNGANLSFPAVFGIGATNKNDPNYNRDQWLVGLVNSAPYAASALWYARNHRPLAELDR